MMQLKQILSVSNESIVVYSSDATVKLVLRASSSKALSLQCLMKYKHFYLEPAD